MKFLFSLAVLMLLIITPALSGPVSSNDMDGTAGMNGTQTERYLDLIEELRCLVCQNQNIAESNAPLARDLRVRVRNMILADSSDAEIKTYMTDHFGDFVLYRPPVKSATWLLWFAPPGVLLLAGVIAFNVSRRSRRAGLQEADRDEVKRLLDDARERAD